MLNFECAHKVFPNGGETTDFTGSPIVGSPNYNANYYKTTFCDQMTDTTIGVWQFPKESHVGPFAQILPYLDKADIYHRMDPSRGYRQSDENFMAAQEKINIYLCPSDPWGTQDTDPSSCGKLDYFATVYTDIVDGVAQATSAKYNVGERDKNSPQRADGALSVPAGTMLSITDGLSDTILIVEDAGRQNFNANAANLVPQAMCMSNYADSTCAYTAGLSPLGSADCGVSMYLPSVNAGALTAGGHMVARWVDPDAGGSGISGPPLVDPNAGTWYISGYTTVGMPFTHWVNQNSITGGPGSVYNTILTTNGGTAVGVLGYTAGTTVTMPVAPNAEGYCPWTVNNCGLNDEPFSFHPNGTNCVMCDGSVHFLSETISPQAMRALVTRSEGADFMPQDELPQ